MLFSLMHLTHIIFVILWIGGLGFVTMLVFPVIFKTPEPLQKVLLFQRIEHRFAKLAKIYNLIVGASGIVMLIDAGWYRALFTRSGIPLTFMVLVWVFWAVMLFGLEPLVIKKMLDNMLKKGEQMDIDAIFARMNRMHWALLILSLLASAAGALTAHGPAIF